MFRDYESSSLQGFSFLFFEPRDTSPSLVFSISAEALIFMSLHASSCFFLLSQTTSWLQTSFLGQEFHLVSCKGQTWIKKCIQTEASSCRANVCNMHWSSEAIDVKSYSFTLGWWYCPCSDFSAIYIYVYTVYTKMMVKF